LQLNSFEVELPTPSLAEVGEGPPTFRAVFIRAPAILEVGPKVEVLAEYDVPESLVTVCIYLLLTYSRNGKTPKHLLLCRPFMYLL
jgi:5'-phosphate synthase pdxT subunit